MTVEMEFLLTLWLLTLSGAEGLGVRELVVYTPVELRSVISPGKYSCLINPQGDILYVSLLEEGLREVLNK
jgi:hypothetical protein